MKKISIILIILISCLPANSLARSKDTSAHYNFTSSYSLLVEQSAILIKKNAGIIACMPLIFYYHKNIMELLSNHPYISSCCLYLLLNYICDCMLEYQQQKPLFDCVPIIKKVALDLVICHGIRNHVHQKKLALNFITDDQAFFNILTEDMNYSFDQIELMTLTMYTKLKERLNSLQHMIHIESEEFVFLCHASSIDMQAMLYLTKNNPDLHFMICNFEKNPQTELTPLVHFLKLQLHHNFTDIQHRLSTQNFNVFSVS